LTSRFDFFGSEAFGDQAKTPSGSLLDAAA
jgi:hypothetical protein